ncbi:MAG: lipoyl(octanoyl) transferase LipB, partial [Nitrospirales bacterium]|nr:lipoyl(octanoyl) transferase LipB [Nitrospirales bacterium]
ELQRELCRERVQEGRPDTLILVEHPPVFTLGRRSKPDHCGRGGALLKRMGYDVYEVERGGSITYHGPGQIVVYPILRLRDFCPGPKIYVQMLEEVVIRVLLEWGIQAKRVEKLPGVWVYKDVEKDFKGGRGEGGLLSKNVQKIAAIGVRISRGVTLHGFALNVNVDLKPFELITPCGIEGCQVTSMQVVLGKPVDAAEVRRQITHHFGKVFELEWKV